MEHLSRFLGCLVYLIGVGAVEGILCQAPETVNWTEAELTCQKYNGKLFQPSETYFDVSPFSEANFSYALWVDATYTNSISIGSDSSGDSFIRCEMCKIEESCIMTRVYKPCGDRCKVLCVGLYDKHRHVLYDRLANWTEAKQRCSEPVIDMISSSSPLFPDGHCEAVCIWTSKIIRVYLHSSASIHAPTNIEGECGILQNGALGFTSCSTLLHPLCERAKTAMETPSLSSSDGFTSCNLTNNTIPTGASLGTNIITATLIISSTYGASATVADKITKQKPFGLNEELSSVSVPVGDSHKPENGALIGGVVCSGVVLAIIIVIVVVILLRRSKQNRNRNSNSQGVVNHDTVLKAKSYVNDGYDDVNGEVTYSDRHSSIQIQHLERDSITYATPSNVEGHSEITRDMNIGYITHGEQMMTVLYSQVQKRSHAGHNVHNINQSTVGDDEYDKINFDKSYTQQAESQGDVYAKTNVNCEHREEDFENVYNKAEFYHERQNIDAGDVYDKANFHGGQHDKRSKNAHRDEEHVSPDQISENIYDKADYDNRLQDESNGYL